MTDGLLVLTPIVFAVFILDWLAVGFSWRKIECFLKPLAMLLIVLWTLTAADWTFDTLLILLVLAQMFGLAGDIFLLLHARWFLFGLGAFLIGHLFYIGIMAWKIGLAFSVEGFKSHWLVWFLLIIGIWAGMLILFYRIIAPKSPRLSMPLFLWVPIQFYGWVLSGLVVFSMLVLITAETFSGQLSFLLIGSILFFVSDSLLAYDRFKRKMPKVRLWIMLTYHLAQFSLAVGFLALLGFAGG